MPKTNHFLLNKSTFIPSHILHEMSAQMQGSSLISQNAEVSSLLGKCNANKIFLYVQN